MNNNETNEVFELLDEQMAETNEALDALDQMTVRLERLRYRVNVLEQRLAHKPLANKPSMFRRRSA